MKGVLISIQRPHTDNIKAVLKTIEVRKNKPNLEVPFTCFIYETWKKGGCGKVIGEFVCDNIFKYEKVSCHLGISKLGFYYRNLWLPDTCLTQKEFIEYVGDKGYGWHISNIKIYDKPKELSEFSKYGCKMRGCACLNHKCKYYQDNGYEQPPDCTRDLGYCYFDKPPQSWCYVEKDGDV